MIVAALLFSCKSEESEPEVGNGRVVLVYMLSDNTLGEDNINDDDLKEMGEAVATNDLGDARILVYHDAAGADPVLMELTGNDGGHASRRTLKKYPRRNSADAEVFRQVMEDAEHLVPSESHGLILWSHALGWLPPTKDSTLKTFGDDGGQEMDILEMCDAIPDGYFDFISADACYMGGIEIAYQLRHKTALYIAPPSEILFDGMPYSVVLPMLCRSRIPCDALCKAVYEYYNKRNEPVAITCIDTRGLDHIAQCAKQVMADGYKDVGFMCATSYSESLGECFMDMAEILKLQQQEMSEPPSVGISEALRTAVRAFYHTETFYELDLSGDCCGISMADYLNCMKSDRAYLRQYDWWKNCLPEGWE